MKILIIGGMDFFGCRMKILIIGGMDFFNAE
jgi:hypothetical protein